MKLILVLILILMAAISSFGQTLSEGAVSVENKIVNAISTHIDAIDTLIEKLRKDLGPENENNSSGVAWTKIEKPNWTKDKVSIRLTMLREGAEIVVFNKLHEQ